MKAEYRKNLKDLATACKNYTDTSIANAKEEIYWHIGEYQVSTQDDNTTASSKTVPANATRCKIKRIYGNTEKFNPSIALDSSAAYIKTMPSTVYDFDVSKVEGNSEKSENLIVLNDVAETTTNGITYSVSNGVIKLNGTSTTGFTIYLFTNGNIINDNGIVQAIFVDSNNTDPTKVVEFNLSTTNYGYESQVRFQSSNYTSTIISQTRSADNITLKTYRIWIPSGSVFNNATFKPMLVKGSTAPTEFKVGYTDIHNFELTGIKVEGSNLCSASVNANGNWDYLMTFYAKPNTTYAVKVFDINTNPVDSAITLCSTENTTTIETYYNGSYSHRLGTGFTFTTGNITEGTYRLRYVKNSAVETTGNPMINYGSTSLDYTPYIAPTTIPIDLSSILYNGSPLFEGNSLKGVSGVKDSVTPYLATKKLVQYTFTGNENITKTSTVSGGGYRFNVEIPYATKSDSVILCNTLEYQTASEMYGNSRADYGIAIRTTAEMNTLYIYVVDIENGTVEDMKTWLINHPTTIVIELATPIEVSINWASLLRGITGYNNGTITLLNTNNQDTDNTITYNSIIKENCCSKIVQSRNGTTIKTINLPTTASDGYSAGSSYNLRDFTTNKRIENVSKESNMYSLNWSFNSDQPNCFRATVSNIKLGDGLAPNVLANNYKTDTQPNTRVNDLSISVFNNTQILFIHDNLYNENVPIFKLAMTNKPLYYELADTSKTETDITTIENVIEVEPSDTLSFYDSNDNLVNVPSDLTYRIEEEN